MTSQADHSGGKREGTEWSTSQVCKSRESKSFWNQSGRQVKEIIVRACQGRSE